MAVLTNKKTELASAVVAHSAKVLALLSQIAEIGANMTASVMQAGGANALVDADFVGDNQHVDAASFYAAVSAIGALTLTSPQKDAIRKVAKVPLPAPV